MHFGNQVSYVNIYVLSLVYLPLLWWLKTQFFESKLGVDKISYFEMTNFRVLDTLTIYSDISKIRVLIQITLPRNTRIQMDISKNNRFSAEEAINHIPRTEKRKKVPVCEMPESFESFFSPMFPILSWELKILAYRGTSTILPSSKLELLRQYEMTSSHHIVTKSSIINDLGVREPPPSCLFSMISLFSVRNITKKIKI